MFSHKIARILAILCIMRNISRGISEPLEGVLRPEDLRPLRALGGLQGVRMVIYIQILACE